MDESRKQETSISPSVPPEPSTQLQRGKRKNNKGKEKDMTERLVAGAMT